MAIPTSELSDTLAAAVESAGGSVVRIEGSRRPSSGVLWSSGVVVAANHALEVDEGLTIHLEDGAASRVTVAGRDRGTDLVVLKSDPGKGKAALLGDLSGLKVGHLVMMLGRRGKTVRATLGIVSALGREPWRTRYGAEIERYLESDASPQPGFSGGPLVGLDGRVLGINTTGLLRGVSLTVPSNTVTKTVEQLLSQGKTRRSWLGLSMQPVRLPEADREATGEEVGLLVLASDKGGPGDLAGIGFGDTLLRLGPEHVRDLADLQAYLAEDHVGEVVPVKVLSGRTVKEINITIGQRPG
jgi:S1-C subfamily serine protease